MPGQKNIFHENTEILIYSRIQGPLWWVPNLWHGRVTSGVTGTLPGSKKHFLWKHGNIVFCTNQRSVEMSTHPVAWQVTSGVIGTLPGSKKHFLWKHGNIEFYTNLRPVEVTTHPLVSKEHSRDLRHFLNIKRKYHVCHIFRAELWSALFIVTFVVTHDKFLTQNSPWWFNFMNEVSVS